MNVPKGKLKLQFNMKMTEELDITHGLYYTYKNQNISKSVELCISYFEMKQTSTQTQTPLA
jgi:hypothetical protein